VALDDLSVPPGAVCLGIGGDRAAPISVDLIGSRTLLLVAGPPRSGRTTLLATALAQSGSDCVVVAPPRSPLVARARRAGVPVMLAGADPAGLPRTGLALVDDVEQFVDSPLGDALERWLAADARRAAVVAGRTDALAVGYRGLLARLRAACCAVVLHPAPGDPAVIAVPVPGSRGARPPGRGVLVPAPAWQLGTDPIAVQLACPDRDARS
jgi:S-DNA-T family DNA segregation ATPase FtsK/SpoIIIE